MLRCKSAPNLDPIRVVSDHLSERITLEWNEETLAYIGQLGRQSASGKETAENEMMNNNIMFRSMFLMNDEPRHFLAPHIPVIPNESDYFQRKPPATANGVGNSGGGAQSVGSQTGTEISTQTRKILKQRPHTCEECGKTFLLKHHLATHIRVHTGERPHVCPECGKTFALKHCLSTHLLLHSAERPYKCNECSKSFTLKHHLVSHEKMHTRERPFECRECGQTFSQKRHLSTHLKFHSGERPFSCQVCGETFTREEHLVMHSRFHGGLQPYICSDCGAGFLRKFQLVEHERQHGRCPDACPSCGKEFLQKRTLLLHVRTCGLTPNPHSVQVDRDPLSCGPQLSKVCKECGEAFSSAEGLALHMRLHIGDHSFLSDICSLAASLKQAAGTQTSLVSSMKKTHSCPDCNRSFTQKHGLNQHLVRYPSGACKLKPFRCEKCGKAFSQKNHLVLHERQHMEPSERSELKNRNLSVDHRMRQMDVGKNHMVHLDDRGKSDGMLMNSSLELHNKHEPTDIRHIEISDKLPQHDPQSGLLRHLDLDPHHILHKEVHSKHQILAKDNFDSGERSDSLMRHLNLDPLTHTSQ